MQERTVAQKPRDMNFSRDNEQLIGRARGWIAANKNNSTIKPFFDALQSNWNTFKKNKGFLYKEGTKEHNLAVSARENGKAQFAAIVAKVRNPEVAEAVVKILGKDYPDFIPSSNFRGAVRDAKDFVNTHWAPVGIAAGLPIAAIIALRARAKAKKEKQERETLREIQQQRVLAQQRLSGIPGGVFRPGMQLAQNFALSGISWGNNIGDILFIQSGKDNLTINQTLADLDSSRTTTKDDYTILYAQSRQALESMYGEGLLDTNSFYDKALELDDLFVDKVPRAKLKKISDLISAHPFITLGAVLAVVGISTYAIKKYLEKRKAKKAKEELKQQLDTGYYYDPYYSYSDF